MALNYQQHATLPLLIAVLVIIIIAGVLGFRLGENTIISKYKQEEAVISPTGQSSQTAQVVFARPAANEAVPMEYKKELPALVSAVMNNVVEQYATVYNQPVLSVFTYDHTMAEGVVYDAKRQGYGSDEWIAGKVNGGWTLLRFRGSGVSCEEAKTFSLPKDELYSYLNCK